MRVKPPHRTRSTRECRDYAASTAKLAPLDDELRRGGVPTEIIPSSITAYVWRVCVGVRCEFFVSTHFSPTFQRRQPATTTYVNRI